MPLLVGCLALVFPRVALFLLWFAGGTYLQRAYSQWIVPVLGFFFLPLTTLVYAFAHNSLAGGADHLTSLGWILVGIALVLDLGLLHRGRRDAGRWRTQRGG